MSEPGLLGKNGCFEVSLGEGFGFETGLCGTLVVWEPVEPWVSDTVIGRAGWLTPGGVLCTKEVKLEAFGESPFVVDAWIVFPVVLLEPASKACGMLVTGEKWGGFECGRVDGSM